MKNRLYLAGGVLLVAAVGGLLWWPPRQPPDPVYNGKPLSYWLTNILSGFSPSLALDPWMGHAPPKWEWEAVPPPSAVPFLIKALERDSWFGASIYRKQVWPKLPPSIKRHLPPPVDNPTIRRQAAYLLGQMGPMAKPATPALIRASKQDDDPVVRLLAGLAATNSLPQFRVKKPSA